MGYKVIYFTFKVWYEILCINLRIVEVEIMSLLLIFITWNLIIKTLKVKSMTLNPNHDTMNTMNYLITVK